MIESVVCCMIILSITTLYLSYRGGINSSFDKTLNVAMMVILIHSIQVLICEVVFPTKPYIDFAAPFGLLYGPLCYFSFLTVSGKELNRNKVLIHLLPFMIGLFFYLLILTSPAFRMHCLKTVIHILYIVMGISMMGYTGLVLFYNGVDEKNKVSAGKNMVLNMILLVFVVALLLFILIYTGTFSKKETSAVLVRMMLYIVMLISVISTFRYHVNRILEKPVSSGSRVVLASIRVFEKQPYQKSTVSAEVLTSYELKLKQMMTDRSVYLDAELTLEKLAILMEIPKHHLTQLFSVRIGRNFYQYVNLFRVAYACHLLKDKALDFKLEEIGFQSGFNSKTSFNRYFKAQMDCTPSDYKEQHSG